MEGYDVASPPTATSLPAPAKRPLDLILLDVMPAPTKTVSIICRELRHEDPRTPPILLTAQTQEAEKMMGFDLGADDYVTKPFSTGELLARIRALLRASGEPKRKPRPNAAGSATASWIFAAASCAAPAERGD